MGYSFTSIQLKIDLEGCKLIQLEILTSSKQIFGLCNIIQREIHLRSPTAHLMLSSPFPPFRMLPLLYSEEEWTGLQWIHFVLLICDWLLKACLCALLSSFSNTYFAASYRKDCFWLSHFRLGSLLKLIRSVENLEWNQTTNLKFPKHPATIIHCTTPSHTRG